MDTEIQKAQPVVPVKCEKSYLHGKLIEDLPHLCSKEASTNRKSSSERKVYTKKIECGYPKCRMVFKRARQFERHYRTVHNRAQNQKLECTVEGCSRTGEEGFTRKDNLIQHMRSVHGQDIPKNPVRFNGWWTGD